MKTVHCCEEQSFDNKISLTPQLSGADRRNCSQIKAYLIIFNFQASTPPQPCSFSNGMHMKKGKKQIFFYIILLQYHHHRQFTVFTSFTTLPPLQLLQTQKKNVIAPSPMLNPFDTSSFITPQQTPPFHYFCQTTTATAPCPSDNLFRCVLAFLVACMRLYTNKGGYRRLGKES